jgi:outer membrane protein OmpA-like peptidoglycan-associated protein
MMRPNFLESPTMQSILKPGVAVAAALFALAGCQTAPPANTELSAARAAVERARSDPYATRSGALEIERAQQALRSAEQAAGGQRDAALARHYAYLAMQRSEIALALGAQAQSEERVQKASLDRERVQLEARTREAELATRSARSAQGDAQAMRDEAERARRQAAVQGERSTALERDLQALQARNTQRGMVVTVGGDVLFDTGKANLHPGAQRHVEQLATVLKQYPERRILIEGFTDSVGPEETNLELSRRRAEAFRQALESAGVPRVRTETRAWGEANPIASNATPVGRQQNRRVEVVLSDEQGNFAEQSSQQSQQSPTSQPQPQSQPR